MFASDFKKAQNLTQYLIIAQFSKYFFEVELFIPIYCLIEVIF